MSLQVGCNYHEEEGDPGGRPRVPNSIIISNFNQCLVVFKLYKDLRRYICKVTMVAAQTLGSGPMTQPYLPGTESLCQTIIVTLYLFHHLAQLPSQLSHIPIFPNRTRQTDRFKSMSTKPRCQTTSPTNPVDLTI